MYIQSSGWYLVFDAREYLSIRTRIVSIFEEKSFYLNDLLNTILQWTFDLLYIKYPHCCSHSFKSLSNKLLTFTFRNDEEWRKSSLFNNFNKCLMSFQFVSLAQVNELQICWILNSQVFILNHFGHLHKTISSETFSNPITGQCINLFVVSMCFNLTENCFSKGNWTSSSFGTISIQFQFDLHYFGKEHRSLEKNGALQIRKILFFLLKNWKVLVMWCSSFG